jgi:diacylglycerol kinase family enzyme
MVVCFFQPAHQYNYMIKAQLIHNPKAGDSKYTKEELLDLLKSEGMDCSYHSSKKPGWDEIDDEAELVIVAGGDGTVRKVTQKLLERKLLDRKIALAVLPLGTANNIANTLYGTTDIDKILKDWVTCGSNNIDIGAVRGLEELFFMEGLGLGVFPKLMKEMKRQERRHAENTEEELKTAQQVMYDITASYQPKHCELSIDGQDYSGAYILVEIMNIRSVGPNIVLAPEADPGDGSFDVVLIAADQQDKLLATLQRKIQGQDERFAFDIVKGRDITVKWGGSHIHVDDRLLRIKKNHRFQVELKEKLVKLKTC